MACVAPMPATSPPGRTRSPSPSFGPVDAIITNPPYTRPVMHALIAHLQRIAPTWLLLELDWAATKQAIPYLDACRDIVIIGRLRWIAGTKHTGKENYGWYRFDVRHKGGPIFHAQGAPPTAPAAAVRNAARPTDHRVRIRGSVPMLADNVPIASD